MYILLEKTRWGAKDILRISAIHMLFVTWKGRDRWSYLEDKLKKGGQA